MKKGILISILLITGIILVVAYITGNYISHDNYYQMVATSSDGKWTKRFLINEKKIDNKKNELMEWLNKLDSPEGFSIVEVIEKDQIQNIDFLKDLCEISEKFRQGIRVDENTVYKSSQHGIDVLSPEPFGNGRRQIYLRKALLVTDTYDLKINVDFELEKGALSIDLISPDGKTATLVESRKQYSGDTKIVLDPGIWSVIYHYTLDKDGIVNGEQEVEISIEK